jgi:phage-related protein
MPAMSVVFFQSSSGAEPVRDWLREMAADHRRAIGEDLKVVQYRWPLGMPLVRKMKPHLWELRSTTPSGIACVFFTVWEDRVVCLHGFIKKSARTPKNELATAERRLAKFREHVS